MLLFSGLFLRDLISLGLLPWHINFRVSLLVPTKLLIDTFIEFTTNVVI